MTGRMRGMAAYAIACAIASMGAVHGVRAQEISDALRLSGPGYTFGARALGMGNAYSTIGNDYSGIRLNPATTGMIDQATYTASVNTNAFPGTSRWNEVETFFSTTSTSFSQLGLSVPIALDSTRNLVFSLGYNQSRDFNSSVKYDTFNQNPTSVIQNLTADNNPILRSLGLSYETYDPVSGQYLGDATVINGNLGENGFILDQGGLIHFSAGFGYEVVSNIYFGASASYATGTYLSDREYREDDTQNLYDGSVLTNPSDPRTADFQSFYLHDVRDVEYSGWDFRFGILYKLWNFIGISAAFKLPSAHTVSEIRSVGGTAEYAGGRMVEVFPSEVERSYRVRPPSEVTAGAMVNLWILTGALEATYIDYTQIEPTSGFSLADRSLGIKEVKTELTQVININGGAEFRIPFTGLSARAGFMYRPSPFKNDPAEFDTKAVTAGIGINSADRLNLDLGYALAFWTQRGSQYGLGDVTQDVVSHNLLISVRFSF